MCFNKKTKNKNDIYNLAVQDIDEKTDYFELIRLSRKIKILQFFIFNKDHYNCLSYLSNPIKSNDGFKHENEEYAYILKTKDNNEQQTIINIHDYFKNKFDKEKELKDIDKKLWSVLHPQIKNLVNEN